MLYSTERVKQNIYFFIRWLRFCADNYFCELQATGNIVKNSTEKTQVNKMLQPVLELSKKAGQAILGVYRSDFVVEEKEDTSPLTLADRQSHEIITRFLKDRYPFPVLSEEGKQIPYSDRQAWEYFWLIDPLDGTKEFIQKNGEFTVNIALIHQNRPVLGIVYAPDTDTLFYAVKGEGAFKMRHEKKERLPIPREKKPLTVIGSRSHRSPEIEKFVEGLGRKHGEITVLSAGSSLKFCLVAEGTADIYPRLGSTMEWDTGAGQIVVEEAGGRVREYESGKTLLYNKENMLNPHFIASGGATHGTE